MSSLPSLILVTLLTLQVSHADLVAESSLEDANDQPVSELLKLLLRSGGSHQGNSKPSPKPSKTSPPPPSTTTTTTTAGTTTMERREATTPESSTQASADAREVLRHLLDEELSLFDLVMRHKESVQAEGLDLNLRKKPHKQNKGGKSGESGESQENSDSGESKETSTEPDKTTHKSQDTTTEVEDTTTEMAKTTTEPQKTTTEPEKTTTELEETTTEPEETTTETGEVTTTGDGQLRDLMMKEQEQETTTAAQDPEMREHEKRENLLNELLSLLSELQKQ